MEILREGNFNVMGNPLKQVQEFNSCLNDYQKKVAEAERAREKLDPVALKKRHARIIREFFIETRNRDLLS